MFLMFSVNSVFGGAARMGKVVAVSPSLATPTMQGGFKADINAMLKVTPAGIGGPGNIMKKFVR
jgi:hypothetical protein